jgi:uncharacterized protein (TIGR03086 family)
MGSELLSQACASTGAILAKVSKDQLDQATPCSSWQVRDVINHVVGATTYFAVTAETGEAPSRQDEPDFADGDFVAAFTAGAARAVAAFGADGVMDKTLKLPFADLPGGVFVNIASGDVFTHGWDLARATGQSTDLDPETAEQILQFGQAFLSEAMRGPDGQAPFGPEVEVPESASAADRLAGFMGRQP